MIGHHSECLRSAPVIPRAARSVLPAALAAWLALCADVSALEIGGNTYDNSDLGLGAGYSFAVVSGTNTHTFTGAGHTWTAAITINAGAKVRIVDGGTLVRSNNAADWMTGTGVLEFNNTTLAHYGDNGIRGSLEFRNNAKLWLRNRAGFNTLYLNDTSELVIDATSSIEADNDTGVGTYFGIRLGAGLTLLGGEINVVDGPVSFYAGSAVRDADGTINVASGDSVTINTTANKQRWGTTATGLTIQGEGTATLQTLNVDGTSGGFLSLETTGASNTWSGSIYLDNAAELRIPAGVTLEHIGNSTFYGGGPVEVDGTLLSTAAYIRQTANNIHIKSGGVFKKTDPEFNFLWCDGADKLTLDSGSLLNISLPLDSDSVNLAGGADGFFDIRTGSTIEVTKGILQANGPTIQLDGVAVPAGSGQTLSAGTYLITGNLNLDANVGANKFSTIGSNATVRLIGTGSSFDAIGTFNTVNGSVGLEDGRQLAITPSGGTLSVGSAASLRFGLNAADTVDPASTTNACLKVTGSAMLTDGAGIDVVDSGGMIPGEYVIVSASSTVSAPGTHEVGFPDGLPAGIAAGRVEVRDSNKLVLVLAGPPAGTVVLIR